MAVTLQMNMYGLVNNQQFAICRHYHSPSAGGMPSISDFGEQIGSQLEGSGVLDFLHLNVTFNTISLRNVVAGSSGTSYQPTMFPLEGLEETAGLPPYNAYKIRLVTVDYAKPSFGWVRLAGVPEGFQSNGGIDAGVFNAMQDAFESFFLFGPTTSGGAGTWLPCVYSRTHENHAIITSVSLGTYLTTQNSRKVGHGA